LRSAAVNAVGTLAAFHETSGTSHDQLFEEIPMGHGDHWEAVEKNYEEFVSEMLPLICEKGRLIGKNTFTHTLDDVPTKSGVVFGLRYLDSPLHFLGLVVGEIEEGNNLWSAYPVCAEGMNFRLVIDAVTPWDNGIEGIIEASVRDGGTISFFDPYFFLNKDDYRLGEEVTVTLGALAYMLRKAEQLEIEIHEGDMLELHRQNVLAEDRPPMSARSLRCQYHWTGRQSTSPMAKPKTILKSGSRLNKSLRSSVPNGDSPESPDRS
jgi:hypothetical protein